MNVNLLAGTAQDGQGGTDSVSNVERAVGTAFDDTLTGDAGENGFEGAGGSDLIDGGANSRLLREMDVARYSSAVAGISASLVTGLVSDGSGGTDTLSNIEGLWGSSYDDTMVGDDNWGNVFIDGGGSDLIDGGSVHDHDTDTGFDMVSYYYGAAVSASITGTSGTVVDLATGTAWTDSLTNIDAVEGSAYGDSLVGGAGSQEFMPNEGNDTVRGGDGEDGVSYWNMEQTISVAWSTDHWVVDIAGGSLGTDLLYDIESIEGSEGADTFNASLYDYSGSYDLVFRGWNGADSFTGGTGWDVVSYWDDPAGVHVDLDGSDFGGSLQGVDGWGNQETLSGIEGIEGSAFDDTLRGNSEVNVFEGWKGNDIIDGGSSINTASYWSSTGGVTANLVTGSADDGMGGTDTLTGIANLIGSVYADSLTGDTLANELNGRGGDDTLVGGTGEPDTVTFKDDPAAVYLNLEAGTATDGWGDTDTLVEIEDVEGSKYDDTLLGSSGTNIIFGGEGDDLIRGGENDDTLSGGDGADTFQYTSMAELGSAIEEISGFVSGTDKVQFAGTWAGATLYWYEEAAYDGIIDGADDSNPAVIWDSSNNQLWYDSDASTSNPAGEYRVAGFVGSAPVMTDIIVDGGSVIGGPVSGSSWTGTAAAESHSGGSGDDTFDGAGGDDTLSGEGGADILKGGAGADSISGGIGDDTLMAYGGADTSSGVTSSDSLYGGDGVDVVTDTASVDFTNMTLDNVETFIISNYQGFTFASSQISNQAWTIDGSQYSNLTVNGTVADDVVNFAPLDTSGMHGSVDVNLAPAMILSGAVRLTSTFWVKAVTTRFRALTVMIT